MKTAVLLSLLCTMAVCSTAVLAQNRDAAEGDSGDQAQDDNAARASREGAPLVLDRGASTRHEALKGAAAAEEPLPPIVGKAVPCTDGMAGGFACRNVDLLSFLPIDHIGGHRGPDGKLSTALNDIWGWTDPQTGREYAIVGRTDGTSFVDVSDPENPVYLGDLRSTGGSSSVWRDIKVLGHHAVIVADGRIRHGLQIFDLHQLRDVDDPPADFEAIVDSSMFLAAHNIVVNETSNFAYAVGSSGKGSCPGLLMIDLSDPENPSFAGCYADHKTGRFGDGYTHDAQCITYDGPDTDYAGREICFGSNETKLQITDVTDRDQPETIAVAQYPAAAYTHQGWLTPDRRYFFQDDELDEVNGAGIQGTRTIIWDVIDLDDPVLVDVYYGQAASIDHNMYIVRDRAFQANYASGLRVLDVSDPAVPVEVGFFDTYVPTDDAIFEGAWSNYPFFESGTVVVSSIGEGLFVLRPTRDASVGGHDEIPSDAFHLSTPYPNPFRDEAAVRLSVDRSQNIRVAMYDVQGRLVRELFAGHISAWAETTIHLEAEGLASGTYVIRAESESGTQSVSATILR